MASKQAKKMYHRGGTISQMCADVVRDIRARARREGWALRKPRRVRRGK